MQGCVSYLVSFGYKETPNHKTSQLKIYPTPHAYNQNETSPLAIPALATYMVALMVEFLLVPSRKKLWIAHTASTTCLRVFGTLGTQKSLSLIPLHPCFPLRTILGHYLCLFVGCSLFSLS